MYIAAVLHGGFQPTAASMIYRGLIALLLLLSVLVRPVSAPADDNEHTKKLTEIRDTLKQGYPALVSLSYNHMVDGYFFRRLEDHTKTAVYLRSRAEQHSVVVKRITDDWLKLKVDIANGIDVESAAVSLRQMLDDARYAVDIAGVIVSDLGIIEQSWLNRCSPRALEIPRSVFTPKTKISPNKQVLNTNPGEFSAYVSVSYGSDAGLTGFSGGVNNGSGFTCSKAGFTGGAIVGTYLLPGIGTAIGSAIGAAAGFVADYISGLYSNTREQQRQESLIDEIYSIQETTINREADSAMATIGRRCDVSLPDDISGSGIRISEQIRNMKFQVNAIRLAGENLVKLLSGEYEILKQRFLEDLEAAVGIKLAIRESEYLAGLAKIFEERQKSEIESVGYLINEVYPLVKTAKDAVKLNSSGEIEVKYELWSKLIEGDAGYSSEMPNQWNSSVGGIKKILSVQEVYSGELK